MDARHRREHACRLCGGLARSSLAARARAGRRQPLGRGDPLLRFRAAARGRAARRSGSTTPCSSSILPRARGPRGAGRHRGARRAPTRRSAGRAAAHGDVPGGDRLGCPRDEDDLDRFEAEVRTAAAGRRDGRPHGDALGTAVRDVRDRGRVPPVRRRGVRSLALAAPVAARHGVRLAVENHKDWRADELVAILKRIGNDHVGVCLDTGNSIALLEDPMEVVEALAPWAFTTHLKDMGVEEYERGFLLAEVPLGTGVLDLPPDRPDPPRGAPEIPLNLEMITPRPARGPLPDRQVLGDLPRPPRPAPGAVAGDGPRPRREAARCRASAA